MSLDTSTSGRPDLTLTSRSPAATFDLGRLLGVALRGGEVFALTGGLGAGKTWFTKGLSEGLGIDPRTVTSPTFLLIHQLEGRLRLHHLDAYRADSPEVFLELGFHELCSRDSVVVIEWAERLAAALPPARLDVRFRVIGETVRELEFRALGPAHEALIHLLRPVLPAEGEGG